MAKKQRTVYGIGGLILGIIGGIAGTAFSVGAEKQRINDTLIRHTAKMKTLTINEKEHKEATQKELDRFAEIIASQIVQLQSSITNLTHVVGNLRTDVHVLKALMERMDKDLIKRLNSD